MVIFWHVDFACAATSIALRPGTGFVLVFQNIIGTLFDSHLADFTHGWLYVIGVGVVGGIALKEARVLADPPHRSDSALQDPT